MQHYMLREVVKATPLRNERLSVGGQREHARASDLSDHDSPPVLSDVGCGIAQRLR